MVVRWRFGAHRRVIINVFPYGRLTIVGTSTTIGRGLRNVGGREATILIGEVPRFFYCVICAFGSCFTLLF